MQRDAGQPLSQWVDAHPMDKRLTYAEAGQDQITFVDLELAPLLIGVGTERRRAYPVLVVGTHVTKSVTLPVYSLAANGLEVRLRGNFLNWAVSVKADRPAADVFFDLFDRRIMQETVYFEGFSADWIFGSYAGDHQEFSLRLSDNFRLHTFMYILTQLLGYPRRR